MAKWNKLIITDAGYQLSAQTLGETKIQYTRAQTTDKDMSAMTADQLKALTKLDSVVQDLPVGIISVQDDHTVNIPVKVTNQDVTEDYLLYGLALYAKPEDGDEVLYGIATAVKPDLIPAPTGAVVTGTNFQLKVHVGDAANVNIVVNPDDSVSNEELDAILKKYILGTDLDERFKNYYTKQEVNSQIENAFTNNLPKGIVTANDDDTVNVNGKKKDYAEKTAVITKNPDTGEVAEQVNFGTTNPINHGGDMYLGFHQTADKDAAIAAAKAATMVGLYWFPEE